MRHEVWQYTNRYGGWTKERRTRVLDRILMAQRELRKWAWVWEPDLGGIEVGQQPASISFEVPRQLTATSVHGLLPY
jgi:hypothetical protein